MLLITLSSHATTGAELSTHEVLKASWATAQCPRLSDPPSQDAGKHFNCFIRLQLSVLTFFLSLPLLLLLLSYKKKQERFIHGGPLQPSPSFQSVQMGEKVTYADAAGDMVRCH